MGGSVTGEEATTRVQQCSASADGAATVEDGGKATNEVAVMLDCFGALKATGAALAVEDAGYEGSFIPR